MKITDESHLDHGLTEGHIDFLMGRFGDRKEFFIETVEVPTDLPSLTCGLHGPIMGDEPLGEDEVFYTVRPPREYPSRMTERAPRDTRLLTVIAGPDGDEPCVLYTAFGGPLAPREPGDPTLPPGDRAESEAFWSKHALSASEV